MNIRLHVERLILDGLPVDSSHGPHIQVAVEGELTRLLTADGLGHALQAGGAVPQVPASAIRFTPDASPAHLGKQIAGSVYEAIGKTK
jgi:hypothetical protein